MECLEEMRTIVQEGSEIRAENNKKDDRVMALAMGVRAWHDSERAALVTQKRTREIEQARKNPREEDMQKMFFSGITNSFFVQQQGERKSAVIQLKNALQKDPNNVDARYMLAGIYNQTGDPVSAEKELRKALSLGLAADKVKADLGKSLLLQGQYQKALDETKSDAAPSDPAILAGQCASGTEPAP